MADSSDSSDVIIRISAKNLSKKEFDAARKQLREVGEQAGLTTPKLNDLGTSFKRGALQAVGFGTAAGVSALAVSKITQTISASIRSFAQFESSMTQLETLVGLSRKEVDGLTKSVKEISAATGRGPQELATSLFFIESAGLRGKDALDLLEASAKGAAVGLGESKDIADAATSVMNAFGSSVIDAETTVDVLLKTVREGKLAPSDLASSLGKVIPVAAEMGVSFQEVGGAIASMTRVGRSASESTTALTGIMAAFLKPTTEAEKVLAGIGKTAASVREEIKQRGLIPVIQELREQLSGDEFAKVIGQVEALGGALSITGDRFQETSDIIASTTDSAGALEDAFARVEETSAQRAAKVSAAWLNAKNDIGEAFIGIGADLIDFFDDAADRIAQFDRRVTELDNTLNVLGSTSDEAGQRVLTEALEEEGLTVEQLTAGLPPLISASMEVGDAFESVEERAAAMVETEIKAGKIAQALAGDTEKLGNAEKSRIGVLRELNEMQAEGAAFLAELAFQQTVFNKAMRDFPADAGPIPGLTSVAGTPFLDEISIVTREWKLGVEEVKDETNELEQAQRDYNEALQGANAIAQLIGGNVGQIVGQSLAAAAAIQGLTSAGGIGGAFAAGKGESTGILGVLGGVAGAVPLIGPIVGIGLQLGAALMKAFGRGADDVMDDVMRDIGSGISEGLAEQILESGENAQLFLREIFAEGNLGIDKLAEEVGDLFSFFERGDISKPELIEELKETIPILIQNFQELGPEGEAQIERILAAAKRFGIELDVIDDLMQATFAPATMEEIAEQFGKTNDEVRELAEKLGIEIQTDLERMAAGVGLNAEQFKQLADTAGVSLEQLGPLLESLGVSAGDLAAALGIDLGDVETGTQGAADETERAADEAARFADEMERAARAAGGIRFPQFPGGGPDSVGAASGFFKKLSKDTLIFAHAGELAAIIPKDMAGGKEFAFFSAQKGFGRRGDGGGRDRFPGGGGGGGGTGGDGGTIEDEFLQEFGGDPFSPSAHVRQRQQRPVTFAPVTVEAPQVTVPVTVSLPQFADRSLDVVMDTSIMPKLIRQIQNNVRGAADDLARALRDKL